MRIALAQINPIVGDVEGNAAQVLDAARRAHAAGASLVVFPELALVGYPPLDLLDRAAPIDQNLRALDALARDLPPVTVVVGCVERNATGHGRPAFNTAVVIEGGSGRGPTHRYSKRLLPTYDVFDEDRHFEPGSAPLVFEHSGRRVGVTICEDLWTGAGEEGVRYRDDPMAATVAAGADVVLNLAASAFTIDKRAYRFSLLGDLAARHGVPIVFVNQVGGNDELIFDGHSAAIDRRGRLIRECAGFEPDLAVVDPFDAGAAGGPPEAPEPEMVRRALGLGVRDYVRKCGFSSVVLGLSGGIDSAVVACLAAEALGPANVTALAMPSRFSSAGSLDDARALAAALEIRLETVSIEPMFSAYLDALRPLFLPTGEHLELAEENLQSRIRGALVMAWSNRFGPPALATGNKSELAVGYATLYGDMCGALAPIGDLLKRRVYDLARRLDAARPRIPPATMSKPPSAELRPDQKDEDSLPPYAVLDAVLEMHVERGMDVPGIVASGIDEATALHVVSLVRQAEYKRRQAPPVLKVTRRAFGLGRRMPIAHRWRSS
ncbi:MAG: NAD+ synthase [Myxococcota bacterium]|nr:NAD+ synthase [Myxococcota bacterium]